MLSHGFVYVKTILKDIVPVVNIRLQGPHIVEQPNDCSYDIY